MTNPEWDERMAALYDAENTWADDDEFFLALVNRSVRARVLDLGCGTGRLTTRIAVAGHDVTGIDPNATYLHAARAKDGGELVTWIQGTSTSIPAGAFDIALMTSHVAQIFCTDSELVSVFADLHRGLAPGGLLSFDSRDPDARAWEAWSDVESVEGDVVTFAWQNVFSDGSVLQGRSSLRFRSEAQLRELLTGAGFEVVEMYGGWHNERVGAGCGELVVVARSSSRD